MRLPVVLLAALVVAGCTPASGEGLGGPEPPTARVVADVSATPSPTASAMSSVSSAPAPTPTPTFTVTDSATPAPVAEAPTPTPPATPTPTPTPTPTASVAPAPVGGYVLGDSISLAAAADLSRLGYSVVGRVGQAITSDFLTTYLSSSQAQLAPAWVIILGTNNRGDDADVARVLDWVKLIKDLRTPGARQHVYWVTPHRPEAYSGGLSGSTLDAFNAELMTVASTRGWLDVLDYDSLATANPEWFAADGAHLHPDAAGQRALAELIAGADATNARNPATVTDLDKVSSDSGLTPEQEYFQDYEFSND